MINNQYMSAKQFKQIQICLCLKSLLAIDTFVVKQQRQNMQYLLISFNYKTYRIYKFTRNPNTLMQINLPDKGIFKGIGSLERATNNNKKNFPKIRNFHQFQYTHDHPNEYQTTFKKFHQPRTFSKNDYMTAQNRTKKNPTESHWSLALPDSERFRIKKRTQDDQTYLSLNQSTFKKPEYIAPLGQIKQKQEGLGFGDRKDVQADYQPPKQKGKKLFNRFNQLINQNRTTKLQGQNSGYLSFNKEYNQNSSLNKFGVTDFKSVQQITNNSAFQQKTKFHTTNMDHFGNPSKVQMKSINYKFDRNRRFNPITGQEMGKTTNFSYEDFNEGSKQTYKANNFTRIERGGMKEDIISGRMINY